MKRVDVVYTLANKSLKRDDWELRYSLRSLAAQEWVRRVYLIGHRPKWVRGVIHVPCDDPLKPKDANIIRKVLLACEQPGITKQFVINSDDHYILRPIALEELGPWQENPSQLKESVTRRNTSTWCRRLVETIAYCHGHRHPEWVFECHIPYLVDRARYQEVMACVPWKAGNGLVTHVYYNVALTDEPRLEDTHMTVRVKQFTRADRLAVLTAKATFLNHNNNGLCPAVKRYLEVLFPESSRWEA